MARPKDPRPGSRRMPSDSAFFERIVPLILLVMALLFVLMLAGAVAAFMGWLHL